MPKINQTIRGTIFISNRGVTNTATIASVNTAKTELRQVGKTTAGTIGGIMVAVTNSTTLTATNANVQGTYVIGYDLTEWK